MEGKAAEILSRCPEDIAVYTAELDVLTQLTGFKLTRGMLCAMRRPALKSVAEICTNARRIAVLENVMNPTNIGAIFRSAAALGMDAVLLTAAGSDPLYRRASRVSMGTVFQVPWTYLPEDVSWQDTLHGLGFKTAAMALRDDTLPSLTRVWRKSRSSPLCLAPKVTALQHDDRALRLHSEDSHVARCGLAERCRRKRRGVLSTRHTAQQSMRKGRCPPGQRPSFLPLFKMHAVFFVAAFTRFFILFRGIAECKSGMRHDSLRQVKQCGLLFNTVHLRPCAEPHRAEAECIGAKRHILHGNGAVDDPIVLRGWECTLEIAADQNGGRSLFSAAVPVYRSPLPFKQLFAVGDDDERPIARIHAARALMPASKIRCSFSSSMGCAVKSRTLLRLKRFCKASIRARSFMFFEVVLILPLFYHARRKVASETFLRF